MSRWFDDERIVALTNAGRLHDGARKRQLAAGGNGNVVPVGLNKIDREHIADAAGVDRPRPSKPVQSGSTPDVRSIPKAAPLYPLVTICRGMKLPEPIPEYPFAKERGRKWRADYCWPMHMLILEVEGGLWTNGRHSRGKGAIADLEKYSEAAILGYRVIYCTPDEMHNGVVLDRIVRALADREAA